MSNETHCFAYRRYKAQADLPEDEKNLAERARAACAAAYAPYSGFRVGAAILFEDGEVMTSANQESEVLPSGICAERGLLYYAQANGGGRKITALAIASEPSDRECSPCGACRQVIADTEKRQGTPMRVIMCSARSATVVDHGRLLMPFAFEL